MPAEETAQRQQANRQRRRMHEALVGAHDFEIRKVAADIAEVIDQGIGIERPVGVAMGEVLQLKIFRNALRPGVRQVLADDAAGVDAQHVA